MEDNADTADTAEIDILKKLLVKLQNRETPNQAAMKHLKAIQASSNKETLSPSKDNKWQVDNHVGCCIIS